MNAPTEREIAWAHGEARNRVEDERLLRRGVIRIEQMWGARCERRKDAGLSGAGYRKLLRFVEGENG